MQNPVTNCSLRPVKLRLIWRGEESISGSRPKLCFNETLSDVCLSKWRTRVASKFGAGGNLALMYAPPTAPNMSSSGAGNAEHQRLQQHQHQQQQQQQLPETLRELVSDEDLAQLRRDYAIALSKHKAARTLRLAVFVEPRLKAVASGEHCGATAAHEHQCSSGPASIKSCRVASPELRAGNAKKMRMLLSLGDAGSHRSAPHLRCRSDNSGAVTQLCDSKHQSVLKAAAAQPDLFWDRVLHSIIKTVDRHHFGRGLNAKTATPAGMA